MQDDTISPAAGDKVTFKVATHLAAAKAAANSAALNKKYAGKSCCVTHANNYMRTGNFECPWQDELCLMTQSNLVQSRDGFSFPCL